MKTSRYVICETEITSSFRCEIERSSRANLGQFFLFETQPHFLPTRPLSQLSHKQPLAHLFNQQTWINIMADDKASGTRAMIFTEPESKLLIAIMQNLTSDIQVSASKFTLVTPTYVSSSMQIPSQSNSAIRTAASSRLAGARLSARSLLQALLRPAALRSALRSRRVQRKRMEKMPTRRVTMTTRD